MSKHRFTYACFAVSGIDRMVAVATAAGIRLRNQTVVDRRPVSPEEPDGITVEFAE